MRALTEKVITTLDQFDRSRGDPGRTPDHELRVVSDPSSRLWLLGSCIAIMLGRADEIGDERARLLGHLPTCKMAQHEIAVLVEGEPTGPADIDLDVLTPDQESQSIRTPGMTTIDLRDTKGEFRAEVDCRLLDVVMLLGLRLAAAPSDEYARHVYIVDRLADGRVEFRGKLAALHNPRKILKSMAGSQ